MFNLHERLPINAGFHVRVLPVEDNEHRFLVHGPFSRVGYVVVPLTQRWLTHAGLHRSQVARLSSEGCQEQGLLGWQSQVVC